MILTIDIGTSTLKLALYEGAKSLAFTRQALSCSVNTFNFEAIKTFITTSGYQTTAIKAIAISSQAPTLVALNEHGQLITVLYYYAAEQRLPGLPSAFLPKILAFKEQQPHLYRQTACFLTLGDYLAYLLSGQLYTSLPMHDKRYIPFMWDKAQLAGYGFDEALFAPFYHRESRLTNGSFGLVKGLPVVSVTFDFLAALVGSGALSADIGCNRNGSSEGLNFLIPFKASLPSANQLNWRSFPHAIATSYNAGLIFNYKDYFDYFKTSLQLNDDNFFAELLTVIDDTELPSRLNDYNFGVFSNDFNFNNFLQLINGCSAFQQAAMALKFYGEGFGKVVKLWPNLTELRLSGGAALNNGLNQYKANCCGIPCVSVQETFTELLGNVIIAYIELGRYANLNEAGRLIKVTKTYLPN
ncbi:MAG: FGGY-family carbohydrate kinase [Spirochaetaceae bacterium]|nr:FGGY-family carbohydrate kinase [Spirochaetaceae bacterium]